MVLESNSAALGDSALKYIIEILALDGSGRPRVLHSFTHTASSIHMVQESLKAVHGSNEWPVEAQGFRILSEVGLELYSWPD